MITPVIIPVRSESRPCPCHGKCPCHDDPEIVMPLFILFTVVCSSVVGFLQWKNGFLDGFPTESLGDRIVGAGFAACAAVIACIIVYMVACAVWYAVKSLFRAIFRG
jgi:hypothetical protein